MKFADRINRLGTETAFAVSAEATAFASQGNKVYPFHLGDLNLKTPANVLAAGNVAGILSGYPAWNQPDILSFLEGESPRAAPSIVNATELGIALYTD